MAFIGWLNGRRVVPEEVEDGTDVQCPECNQSMFVWGPSEDGTARHFKHYAGERDCEVAQGESDIHRKLKSISTSHLKNIFEGRSEEVAVEYYLESPRDVTDCRYADAIVNFEDRDEQLGEGLIIEVQYRNEGKKIKSTTADYVAQDYSVAWLDEGDFANNQCLLSERRLRERTREATEEMIKWVSHDEFGLGTTKTKFHDANQYLGTYCKYHSRGRRPLYLFEHERRERMGEPHSEQYYARVPAKLPAEFFDEKSQELWNDQPWEDIIHAEEDLGALPPSPTEDVPQEREVPAKMVSDLYDDIAQDIWNNQSWENIVGDEGHTIESLPPQPTEDVPYDKTVPAYLVNKYIDADEILTEIHRRQSTNSTAPIKERACPPGKHDFEENAHGMMFCVICEVTHQSLTDVAGQELRDVQSRTSSTLEYFRQR